MPKTIDTQNLKAIWHLINDDVEREQHGAEDADAQGRRFGVAKRNVLSLVEQEVRRNITVDELCAVVEDVAMDCEVDERHYGPSWPSAFELAKASITAEDEVLLEDFLEDLSIGHTTQASLED